VAKRGAQERGDFQVIGIKEVCLNRFVDLGRFSLNIRYQPSVLIEGMRKETLNDDYFTGNCTGGGKSGYSGVDGAGTCGRASELASSFALSPLHGKPHE
jgi:hypothetical protein